MANFGVVGSRRRRDKQSVIDLIDSLPADATVVSGGCKNSTDTWAVDRAKERGLKTKVFRPKITKNMRYPEIVKAYYARNRLIALNSEKIYAFVAEDRKGGTENTIAWANKFRIPVELR